MLNQIISELPLELLPRVEFLITLLQAAGWAIIFYVIFSSINIWANRKKRKEMEKINKNLDEIKNILKKKYK